MLVSACSLYSFFFSEGGLWKQLAQSLQTHSADWLFSALVVGQTTSVSSQRMILIHHLKEKGKAELCVFVVVDDVKYIVIRLTILVQHTS